MLPAGLTGPGPALALRARVVASLAWAEAERGGVAQGLRLMDQAKALASQLPDHELQGVLAGQHGVLLSRSGRLSESLAELDRAVHLLDGAPPYDLCTALLNRSSVHLYRASLPAARTDIERCWRVATTNGDMATAAKARHNLGYAWLLAGDLPEALRAFEAARDATVDDAPVSRGMFAVDRAHALREAGLLGEAETELSAAVTLLKEHRLGHDLAEAELASAQVAMLSGKVAEARRFASAARRRFRARGNQAWALIADLWALQTRINLDRGSTRVAAEATALAEQLRQHGLRDDGNLAALLAANELLKLGNAQRARSVAGRAVRLRGGDRLRTRLLARLIRSELAEAAGDPAKATRELREGLRDLQRHQSRFGSMDLQTASTLHGHRLAARGLARALADGRPSVVFAWLERARALAFNLPPVRPPDDPMAAELLAELRGVRTELRSAELAGRRAPALRAKRAELERQIRQRSWFTAGPGTIGQPASLGQVRAALAEQAGCLVAYLAVDGRLHALVVGPRAARVVRLGRLDEVTWVLQRVRADLDAAAMTVVPAAMREVVHRSLTAGLRRLDEALWRPLVGHTGSGPVMIVPTAPLGAVPWGGLPGMGGRPVAVAPSATWWLAARERAAGLTGRDATPVFAAGPGVPRADSEVHTAAAAWPAATVLTGADATGAAVLRESAARPLLHLAAHGVHEPDNPLFSSVQLADGPLFGYDLPRAAAPPAHVVLSACDLGLAEVRPGDEALGMTSALLHSGVVSVVAGVARVGDEVANTVMIGHHKALAGGDGPAIALAYILDRLSTTTTGNSNGAPAPLVCFGAGW